MLAAGDPQRARFHLLVAGDAHFQRRHGITSLSRNTASTAAQKSESRAAASPYTNGR